MKVAFIYIDNSGDGNRNKFNRGVAMLSASLKKHGHETALVHVSDEVSRNEIRSRVRETGADILAFSYISLVFRQAAEIAEWTSDLGGFRIHGGCHATMMPEESIELPGTDAVCIGEGETAIVELVDRLEDGREISSVPSLWIRTQKGVTKNEVGPLCVDLDSLPFPDYEIFPYEKMQDYIFFKRLVTQASRGCPFACTYCANNYLHRLYPNRKHYVRRMSVRRLIDEIKNGLAIYPELESVRFFDDTLTSDDEWLEEFISVYTKEVGMPFSGNDRVENITEEKAKALKAAGCTHIDLGIENGDENIRRKVMKRYISDEMIVNAFRVLADTGIKANAFNILGIPTETRATLLSTVKINAKVKAAECINAYFHPLPKTAAAEMCREKGLNILMASPSLFTGPVVDVQTASVAELRFFFVFFNSIMKLYMAFENYPRLERILNRILMIRNLPLGAITLARVWTGHTLSKIRAFLRSMPLLPGVVRFIRKIRRK